MTPWTAPHDHSVCNPLPLPHLSVDLHVFLILIHCRCYVWFKNGEALWSLQVHCWYDEFVATRLYQNVAGSWLYVAPKEEDHCALMTWININGVTLCKRAAGWYKMDYDHALRWGDSSCDWLKSTIPLSWNWDEFDSLMSFWMWWSSFEPKAMSRSLCLERGDVSWLWCVVIVHWEFLDVWPWLVFCVWQWMMHNHDFGLQNHA